MVLGVGKKTIWIIAALIIVLVGGIIIKLNSNISRDSVLPYKVSPDYFAKLQTGGPALLCTYLYVNIEAYSYINTEEISHEMPPYDVDVKVIESGKSKYPKEVLKIAEEFGSLGAVILNKDIAEVVGYRKGYKKGDIITLKELETLIAIE